MNKGYILLHRQIEDNPFWEEKPFDRARAWIDMLMMANYKDKRTIIKGQLVTIKRGQFLRGTESLAERWGWSRGKVRRTLDLMERDGMIKTERTANGTLVTIENYESFQDWRPADGTTDGQANFNFSDKSEPLSDTADGTAKPIENYSTVQHGRPANSTADGTTDGTTVGTGLKESKKKVKEGGVNAPPAAAIFSFFAERGYKSDPEQFIAYYEDTGWRKKNGEPITSWKSAAIAWERREKEFKPVPDQDGTGGFYKPEPPKYRELKPEPEIEAVPPDPEQRRKLEETKLRLLEAIT